MTQCGHEHTRACDGCPPEHIDRLFESLGSATLQSTVTLSGFATMMQGTR